MLTSTPSPESLFHIYLTNPTPASSLSLVKTCLRFTHTPPTPSLLTLAQKALSHLSKHPNPATLPTLLSICETDPSTLHTFLLSSAAWKPVLAVVHHCQQPRVATRLLLCAIQSALGICGRCLRGGGDGVERCVKIVRFYCGNLLKCCQRCNVVLEQPQIKLVLCSLLALMALISFVFYFDDSVFCQHKDPIQHNIIPLLISSFQAIVSNLSLSTDHYIQIFKAVLSEDNYSDIYPSLTIPNNLLRLLALLHILNSIPSLPNLHSIIHPLLLPTLFQAIDQSYIHLSTLSIPSTSQFFLNLVVHSTAQSLAAIEHCTDDIPSLRDTLLQNISAAPAHFLIANQTILRISDRPDALPFYTEAVLACTRISLAFEHPHAVTRWLPLAAQLCSRYIQNNESLYQVLESSIHLANMSCEHYDLITDPLLLPLISAIIQEPTDASTHPPTQAHSFQKCLQYFDLPLPPLRSNLTQILSHPTRQAALCIPLIPHLHAPAQSKQLLVSLLQRFPTTPSIIAAILSRIPPHPIVNDCLRVSIQKHQLILYPHIAAFVARNVQNDDTLIKLLETCVRETQKMHDPCTAIIHTAVMRHAAVVMDVLRGRGKVLNFQRYVEEWNGMGIAEDEHLKLVKQERKVWVGKCEGDVMKSLRLFRESVREVGKRVLEGGEEGRVIMKEVEHIQRCLDVIRSVKDL